MRRTLPWIALALTGSAVGASLLWGRAGVGGPKVSPLTKIIPPTHPR